MLPRFERLRPPRTGSDGKRAMDQQTQEQQHSYGQPALRRITLNDTFDLAVYHWGEHGSPPVLLVHATGFHGRCWDQVVAALPPGLSITAFDMRGHGHSDRPGSYHWDEFGQDLIDLVDTLSLSNAIVVGHSMGGHCAAQLAARRPESCARLILIDPVIFEPEAYPENRHRMYGSVEDHPVARRRSEWESWEAMRDQLVTKGAYGLWDPRVLDDYCRFGSLPKDGGVELACPPVVEASVYLGNTETDVHAIVGDIDVETLVLRAPPRDPNAEAVLDFSKSPTWPALATVLPKGTDVLLEHLTHFIPMQAPELVAGYISQAARELSR